MAKRLFVGNLPWSATDADLKELFSQAGNVSSVQVILHRDTGRSKGYAFVEMSTDEEAARAVEMFNGKDMAGRPLVVNEARPMEPRAPRRDFRGGGGNDRGGRDY